jgi:hypothetical protein
MRTKWLRWLRIVHVWMGVFFSPLLLFFVATGWWQTFTTDDRLTIAAISNNLHQQEESG